MPNCHDGRLDLAHEQSFMLGDVLVEPSRRTVRAGEISLLIEPRVMQLLVALHEADGATLSRDDLIERCWGGRLVGDNAIHRAVLQARKITPHLGSKGFRIESIKGVGYRLTVNPSTRRERLAGAFIGRRAALGVVGAIGAATAGGVALWQLRDTKSDASPLAMDMFERGEIARREEDGYVSADLALALYQDAIEDSPRLAKAWGGMALAYCSKIGFAFDPDVDRLAAMSIRAARTALDLDPSERRARMALVMVAPPFRNWQSRHDRLERLHRQAPHEWEAPAEMGRLLSDIGSVGTAVMPFRRALRAEPLLPRVQGDLFYTLWSARRLRDAESVLETGLKRWPRNWYLWNARFQYLATTGAADAAINFVKAEASWPLNLSPVAIAKRVRAIEVLAGRKPEARQASIDSYLDEVRETYAASRNAATMLAALGAGEQAIEILSGYFFGQGRFARPLARYSRRRTAFLFHPPFDLIRNSPGFIDLMRRIGLPPAIR